MRKRAWRPWERTRVAAPSEIGGRRRGPNWKLVLVLALGLGVALALGATAVRRFNVPAPVTAGADGKPMAYSQIFERVAPAVLSLRVAGRARPTFGLPQGQGPSVGGGLVPVGSAFFISADGLVVTNANLIEGARAIAVTLQVTPLVAIAPLVTIWAGIDHPERAVVGLAAVVAFFPIFSGALTGLKSVDPDLARLFDLYGAGPAQRLWRLRLPSAVPSLLEGHKVATGLAVIGAVVAEFVAGSGGAQGLAWRILEAGNRLQTDRMFAALAALAALGLILHGAFHIVERRLLAWWSGSRR